LLGDWQRGPALIKIAIKHNPFYNIIVHYALRVDWVRQENYQQAYLETLNFRTPMLFWDLLMKAANFGLLGRIEAGRQAAKVLLTLKPDLPSSGAAKPNSTTAQYNRNCQTFRPCIHAISPFSTIIRRLMPCD
jgi:hypothetical protein